MEARTGSFVSQECGRCDRLKAGVKHVYIGRNFEQDLIKPLDEHGNEFIIVLAGIS